MAIKVNPGILKLFKSIRFVIFYYTHFFSTLFNNMELRRFGFQIKTYVSKNVILMRWCKKIRVRQKEKKLN